MTDEDAELVALIDDELDENRRNALLARLATDERLRERYDQLREAGAPIAGAFEGMLEQAPLARLSRLIPPELPAAPQGRRAGFGLRDLAAAFLVGILAAGAVAWIAFGFGLLRDEDDWRTAVVNYMELYTKETFAPFNPDAETQAKELAALGARVGVPLTPDRVALPGLHFKAAINLAYEGAPLGEIAYVDDSGDPVLFCVVADGRADAAARAERRGDYRVVDWSRGGRGFLVIGRMAQARAAELAQTLERRI